MRRTRDSFLNATQILKLAGIDKARRTKIIEKEILSGDNEKVQGGYGKYQGTWVPYDRALKLCHEYEVYELLSSLLLYDISKINPTPTKEQAMAAKRKRLNDSQSQNEIGGGVYESQYNSLNSNTNTNTTSISTLNSPTNDKNPTDSNATGSNKRRASNSIVEDDAQAAAIAANIKKRKFASSPKEDSLPALEIYEHDLDNPNAPYGMPPLERSSIPEYDESNEMITQIFLGNPGSTLLEIFGNEESFKNINLNIPIDDSCHTALHWAAALARLSLVKDLIKHDCNRLRVNNNGETPLIKAVLVTNNYDRNCFPELLDLLYPCITIFDRQGRTLLHHIALTAGIRGRSAASRYYLECLLEWIVRRGSSLKKNPIGIGRFMAEMVNAQDRNGDTCLNIAARIGNKAIAQQLLDVGADPTIPNRAGLKPVDFGIVLISGTDSGVPVAPRGTETVKNISRDDKTAITTSAPTTAGGSNLHFNNGSVSPGSSTEQKSKDIMASISGLLSSLNRDFEEEIQLKQNSIDNVHSQVRDSSLRLSETRQKLDNLRSSSSRLTELNQRSQNLEKAIALEDERFQKKKKTGTEYNGVYDPDDPFRVYPVVKLLQEGKTEEEILQNPSLVPADDLPPIAILKARINAYKENQESFKSLASELKNKSRDLENKFRRVVSLCTGVTDDGVDGLLEGLVQAVESDREQVNINRVSTFLRKVDESL